MPKNQNKINSQKNAIIHEIGKIMGCKDPKVYQIEFYFEENDNPDVKFGFTCLNEEDFKSATDNLYKEMIDEYESDPDNDIASFPNDFIEKLEKENKFLSFDGRSKEFML